MKKIVFAIAAMCAVSCLVSCDKEDIIDEIEDAADYYYYSNVEGISDGYTTGVAVDMNGQEGMMSRMSSAK